jgi:hypothetical protein
VAPAPVVLQAPPPPSIDDVAQFPSLKWSRASWLVSESM